MAKIALDSLASRIADEIKSTEYYREEVLNKQQHKYTLTGEGLYDTVSEQLKNVKKYRSGKITSNEFDSILKRICYEAAPEILNALKNYKGDKARVEIISPTSVLIIPKNPGEDIFELIKATRRRRLNKYLKDPIIKELFGEFNKTSSYKKYMSQSDADYDAQLRNPTQRGAKRINALNQAIFGSRQELTSRETGEKFYKRNSDNQIIVQGGFTDIGHRKEDAVSMRRQAAALENILNDTLFLESIFGGVGGGLAIKVTKEVIGRKLSSIKAGFSDEIKQGFTITIVESTEESSTINRSQGAGTEKRRLASLRPAMIKTLQKESWATQEGSDSPLSAIEKVIINTGIEALTKGKRTKLKTGKKQVIDDKQNSGNADIKPAKPRKVARSSKGPVLDMPASSKDDRSITVQPNWLRLIPVINSKLTPRVIANMRFPSLVNRTGTFAQSAKITNIEVTREGFPSFVFDYERDPYDVFDRTKGRSPWNTPERDPRALVDKSVREIVREMAISRFYTRRA